MALTTPKMVLKVWNLLTDPYDHDQLADNWAKVDQHDHTSNRGVQIPTEGIFDGAITTAKLATGLDPAPAFTAYKPFRSVSGLIGGGTAIGNQGFLGPAGGAAGAAGTSTSVQGYPFYVDPLDFAVAGRATVFRSRNVIITTSTPPTSTYTIFVVPVATWGTVTNPTVATVSGSLVFGSNVAFAAPAVGGPTAPVLSSDFTLTAGWYVVVCSTTVNVSASPVQAYCDLQYRTV